jgi:chromosomal replication initiation ATPase DnaA
MLSLTSEQYRQITHIIHRAEADISHIVLKPVRVMLITPKLSAPLDTYVHIERVLHAIALHTDITVSQMMSSGRAQHIIRARHMAFKLLNEGAYPMSLKAIGRLFKRDHTTVLHGIRSITRDIEHLDSYRILYHTIKKHIEQI